MSAALTANSPPVLCDPQDPAKCTCNGVPIGPHTWTPQSWLVSNSACGRKCTTTQRSEPLTHAPYFRPFNAETSIYETSALIDGVQTPLSKFKAKATMLVNVASA